jgi:hypothetical protein
MMKAVESLEMSVHCYQTIRRLYQKSVFKRVYFVLVLSDMVLKGNIIMR